MIGVCAHCSPKDRAIPSFAFWRSRTPIETELKKNSWLGRIPDELARIAGANQGILTREQVEHYYEKIRNYYSLESQQMFLSPQVVRVMHELADWKVTPVMVYLADSLSKDKEKANVPYSVIAGVGRGPDDAADDKSPRGVELADDEILLTKWVDPFMPVRPGDKIAVTYYAPDDKNHLELRKATFRLKEIVPLRGAFDDPDYTPEFPGITDKREMDWDNPPFPYDPRRGKTVAGYWKRYRTTPKAYINLHTAQRLWGTRFGDITSLQVWCRASSCAMPLLLLNRLKPEQGGFVFQPVRQQAPGRPARGTVDFSEDSLYFSFFLIVSALLLVGLLVRLNLDRRYAGDGAAARDRLDAWPGALAAARRGDAAGGRRQPGGARRARHALLCIQPPGIALAANWPGVPTSASCTCMRSRQASRSAATSLAVSVLTLFWATRC